MHRLSDERLTAELQSLGGLPEQIAANPDVFAFFLPLLRADLALNEEYVYVEEPPLDVPIAAFAGDEDAKVPPDEMALWCEQTTARFTLRVIGGGHFFAVEQAAALLRLIRQELSEWRR